MEDLQSISPSLRDSEYLKDLQGGTPTSQTTASTVTAAPESVDLQEPLNTNSPAPNRPAHFLTTHSPQLNAPFPSYEQPTEELPHNLVVAQLSPKLIPGGFTDCEDSLWGGSAVGRSSPNNLIGLSGSMETASTAAMEGAKDQSSMDFDGEPDLDSFPILIRSMSTSRRHSWGVPLSPINLGRR